MRAILEKTEKREPIVIENNGRKIFGLLHRPIGYEQPPVVVVFHGFASSKQGSNRCYVKLAKHWAQKGIATLRFDFTGSGDSEGEVSDMTFEDFVDEGVLVLKYLESIEGIDANRIALFGASLGGALALLAAARFSVKALALWAPVASGELWYRDFLSHNPQYRHVDPSQVFSTYRGNQIHPLFREQFSQMAAWQVVSKLANIPLLFMQSEKDITVSLAHQEAFKKACGSRKDLRFVQYPEGEHALGFSSCFPAVCQESVAWFGKYLM